jgi:hypothetical protein
MRVLRPLLVTLLVGAVAVACGQAAPSQPPAAARAASAGEDRNENRQGVGPHRAGTFEP